MIQNFQLSFFGLILAELNTFPIIIQSINPNEKNLFTTLVIFIGGSLFAI